MKKHLNAIIAETADSGPFGSNDIAHVLPRPIAPAPVADTARIRAGGAARPA